MERIEKSVFISYRRINFPWALAVWQSLNANGYDVFIDYEGIASGDFETAIVENIRARAHFLIILTPSALERCGDPNDWMRREIEAALESKRNIVPLMLEGFSFGTPSIANQLIGTLAPVKSYNALSVPNEYFREAMGKLRSRFLNVPLSAVIHPPSGPAQQAAIQQNAAADVASVVQTQELTAQQLFERGVASNEPDEEIRFNTEALYLDPSFAEAYNNRGLARTKKGDLEGALADYAQAVRIRPDVAEIYNNRGIARIANDDPEAALLDYTHAIELKPDYASPFYNRGIVLQNKGDLVAALADYTEAIRLKPGYAMAYNNRGIVRSAMGEFDQAIADFSHAIRLMPDFPLSYTNRAAALHQQGNLEGAVADLNHAIPLMPHEAKLFYNRGLMLQAMGDNEKALLDFNEAIRIEPDYAKALFTRGMLRKSLNKPASALADLQHYLEIGGGVRYGDAAAVGKIIAELKKD